MIITITFLIGPISSVRWERILCIIIELQQVDIFHRLLHDIRRKQHLPGVVRWCTSGYSARAGVAAIDWGEFYRTEPTYEAEAVRFSARQTSSLVYLILFPSIDT
jgi:hypothetical protein